MLTLWLKIFKRCHKIHQPYPASLVCGGGFPITAYLSACSWLMRFVKTPANTPNKMISQAHDQNRYTYSLIVMIESSVSLCPNWFMAASSSYLPGAGDKFPLIWVHKKLSIIYFMQIKIDRIIHSHRRSIAIIIQSDGKLVVRAPLRLSHARIQQFVGLKTDWILSQQEKAATRQIPVHAFISGETFLFLGKSIPLELVDHPREALTLDTCFRLRRSDQSQAGQVFLKWYQQQARQIFTSCVQLFAQRYALSYSKIRLSSARTRWGSCSSKGTLSFTWRLVMAPVEVIDYVVIHELVHLEIKNHSSAFWKKVQEYLPDYKKRRAWLKAHGYQLDLGI